MISIAIIALDRQPTSLEPGSAGVRVGRNCYRTHATASVARLAFPFVSPAVNPPNAVLNYLYAVLESDASLAANELGLDPGLGVLHRDTPNVIVSRVTLWSQSGPLFMLICSIGWFLALFAGNGSSNNRMEIVA